MSEEAAEQIQDQEQEPEQEEEGSPSPATTANLVRLCVAAWAIPGLGHFLLGLRHRAGILSASILCMFFFGLGMQGQVFELRSEHWLQSLGYLGEWCVGVVLPFSLWFGYNRGNPFFAGSDYGTAFLVAAGMLNILCILDVYDIALGRKP